MNPAEPNPTPACVGDRPLKVSVIVPCYNEEAVLPTTLARLRAALQQARLHCYELIFINDGSSDATPALLRGFAAADPQVKVLEFSRNFGHQPAVTAGIHYCSGDVAIIIDADLQDPPELFGEMVALYQREGCNVVYGVRTRRAGEGLFKRLSAKLYYRLLNSVSETPAPLDTGDFRLIDRTVIEQFKGLRERNKYIRGLISWLGYKQRPLYYQRDPRYAGVTKYPLLRMLRFATTGLFYFSRKPLSVAIGLGFACLLVGLLLTVYVVAVRLGDPGGYLRGWASIMIGIIFFGGVQLLTIGLLGIYVANIFDEIKQRPEYIVADKLNFGHEKPHESETL